MHIHSIENNTNEHRGYVSGVAIYKIPAMNLFAV